MDADPTPIELERRGWQALSSSGERATRFYGDVLDDDVLVLLPGGTVIDDRELVIASMGGAPWQSYELDDLREIELHDAVRVVTYAAVARREEQPTYSALVSSTWVRREDGWKLAVHQQTPR